MLEIEISTIIVRTAFSFLSREIISTGSLSLDSDGPPRLWLQPPRLVRGYKLKALVYVREISGETLNWTLLAVWANTPRDCSFVKEGWELRGAAL